MDDTTRSPVKEPVHFIRVSNFFDSLLSFRFWMSASTVTAWTVPPEVGDTGKQRNKGIAEQKWKTVIRQVVTRKCCFGVFGDDDWLLAMDPEADEAAR
jgi:hypothetical protein